jgi:hypothetical protein
MHVAIMHSEHYEWIGLGKTAQQAREAIAAKFDQHLKGGGDSDRERFLYEIGLEAPELDGVSEVFGETIDSLAEALDNWYGISVEKLQPGEATYS